MVASMVEILCSCRTVEKILYLDLASLSILPAEKIIVVKLMCHTSKVHRVNDRWRPVSP